MKIIDNTTNREKIVNIPEGSIFRFDGNYYLKTNNCLDIILLKIVIKW